LSRAEKPSEDITPHLFLMNMKGLNNILDLVGGSTVTLLTFVFPPFFYMRLVDMAPSNPKWQQRFEFLQEYLHSFH
jgi:hypothetical protein